MRSVPPAPRHSREGGNPVSRGGRWRAEENWIPAFAGMTWWQGETVGVREYPELSAVMAGLDPAIQQAGPASPTDVADCGLEVAAPLSARWAG